ncbi:hypothetical protein [Herbidospora mongoliensis]|uniref:hypothetical protein n=1 Tax=Herbidospora mongoliensis TaxID=688067 RepID=UPI000AAA76E2|nr:hypothetical protein [Herbidospora mongoliensis]
MTRRIVLLLAFLALLVVPVPAASAGGFAATEVDPIPEIQPGTVYTIGYWVLGLGSEPVRDEAFGDTALRFSGNGQKLEFTGTKLAEPSHYATSIVLPAGVWEVEALQSYYGTYEIGTLTVPGGLTLSPPEYQPMRMAGQLDPWGAIKPPGHPWGTPFRRSTADVPVVKAATVPEPEPLIWPYAFGGFVLAGGLVLLLRSRPKRHEPDQEKQQAAFVIGGR